MILPEDIINNYPFEKNDEQLKLFLINYYNLMTLRNYKQKGIFYTEQEMYDKMPNKIMEFYISKPDLKIDKTKKSVFWADDKILYEKFNSFIQLKYNVSLTSDVKFKDVMIDFSKYINMEVPITWSSKYETIIDDLNIKYEKVIDPRFIGKGNGTCHLFLTPKNDIIITNKKLNNLIPSIPDIPKPKSSIPLIPVIPMIPKK